MQCKTSGELLFNCPACEILTTMYHVWETPPNTYALPDLLLWQAHFCVQGDYSENNES